MLAISLGWPLQQGTETAASGTGRFTPFVLVQGAFGVVCLELYVESPELVPNYMSTAVAASPTTTWGSL